MVKSYIKHRCTMGDHSANFLESFNQTMSKTAFIKPPFPFPERWAMVDSEQRASGVHTWLVPSYERQHPLRKACTVAAPGDGDTANGPTEVDYKHEVDVAAMPPVSAANIDLGYQYYEHYEQYAYDKGDGKEEEDEMLELNPEWAQRFSKAIKKMKQKVHKSRQRASWKKDK